MNEDPFELDPLRVTVEWFNDSEPEVKHDGISNWMTYAALGRAMESIEADMAEAEAEAETTQDTD